MQFSSPCLYTLDRFNSDSEIIVMSSSGAWIWRFATPCIALASIVCICILVFNLIISPTSLRELRSYINQVRTDLISQVLQPGRFTAAEKGLTFHIRDRALNGELVGLMVHDSRAKDLKHDLSGKARSDHQPVQRGRVLSCHEGRAYPPAGWNRDKEGQGRSDHVAFEQYIFDITQFGPKSEAGDSLRRGELYLSELMNPDPENAGLQRNPGRYMAEMARALFDQRSTPLVYIMIRDQFPGSSSAPFARADGWSISMAFGLAWLHLRADRSYAATNLLTLQASAVGLVYGIPIVVRLSLQRSLAHVRMAP